MQGNICDNCEDRRAAYGVNKITVRTETLTGTVTTDSRDEDWCEQCVRDESDQREPLVGLTWTSKGEYFRGNLHDPHRGTFVTTYTIEDAPRRVEFRLVPACPCCGDEYTADHECAGCNNPEHSHA